MAGPGKSEDNLWEREGDPLHGGGGLGIYDKKQRKRAKRAEREARERRNLSRMQNVEEGGDWADMVRKFSEGWEGDPGYIPEHMQKFAPMLFANLLKTGAAKDLMDPSIIKRDVYGPGAATIASGAEQGLRGARGSLALSGLSASGAYPMLEAQMRMQAGGMQGNLYSNLMMQQRQNSWNMTRDVAGMGQGMQPAGGGGQGPGSSGSDWVGPAASALGSFAGWYMNRPQSAPSQPSGGGGGGGGGTWV